MAHRRLRLIPEGRDEADQRKTCAECGQVRLRYLDFAPRWGRCPAHRHLRRQKPSWDPSCAECNRLRDLRTRQPRCFTCDEARHERLRIVGRLQRALAEAGLPKRNARRRNSSALEVQVFGIGKADDPSALLAVLQELAGDKVRLKVDPFVVPPTQLELVRPQILDAPPPRCRTYAPVWDLRAAAGPFRSASGIEILGYMDAGQRTTKDQFVVVVDGCSMEPEIRSGSYCLFQRRDFGPDLDGKIVLAQKQDGFVDDDDGSFTVKRLRVLGAGRSRRIELHPTNRAFRVLTVSEGDEVTIVGVYRRALEAAG